MSPYLPLRGFVPTFARSRRRSADRVANGFFPLLDSLLERHLSDDAGFLADPRLFLDADDLDGLLLESLLCLLRGGFPIGRPPFGALTRSSRRVTVSSTGRSSTLEVTRTPPVAYVALPTTSSSSRMGTLSAEPRPWSSPSVASASKLRNTAWSLGGAMLPSVGSRYGTLIN